MGFIFFFLLPLSPPSPLSPPLPSLSSPLSLTELDACRNQISYAPGGLFLLPNLTSLNLSYNLLQRLPGTVDIPLCTYYYNVYAPSFGFASFHTQTHIHTHSTVQYICTYVHYMLVSIYVFTFSHVYCTLLFFLFSPCLCLLLQAILKMLALISCGGVIY